MRLTKIILLLSLALFFFYSFPAKPPADAASHEESAVEEPGEPNAIPASPLVLPRLLKF